MKGRSQRLPPPAAHMDDWVDGSWTVDCPCGVTYDDGDEMVKCDECGVWVHTRCTRFVKEEASFTCDKCKGSRADLGDDAAPGTAAPAIANIEETEVAQLLAELPTKADPCPPPTYQRTGFRRWAELPMEEKVHVQGVPGGDPALFAGVSAVFSGKLWKCTGYVPKKFNFKYREFPCWDHDESDNPASTGADLLVSLSAGVLTEAVERLESPAVTRSSSDGKGLFSGSGHSFTKKERSKFRGHGFHSGKRREVDSTGSKDRSVKKIRISASNEKNRGTKHAGSAPRGDGSKLGLIDKGIARRLNVELEKMRYEDKRVEKSSGPTNDIRLEGESIKDDVKNASSVMIPSGVAVSAASERKSSPEAHVKEEKVEVQGTVCNGNLSKTEGHAKSAGPTSLIAEVPAKEDADDNKPNRSNDECSDFGSLKHASIRFDIEPGQLKHTIGDFASGSQIFLEPNNKSSKRPFESKRKEETISDADQADEMRKKPAPFVSSGLEAQSLETEHVKGPCISLPNNPQNHEMLTRQEKDAFILQVDKKELTNQPVCEQSARIISGPSESKKLGPEQETMGGQSTGIVSEPSEFITLGPEQEPMGEQSAGVVSKPSESKKLGPEQEPVGQDKTVEAHHSPSSTREHAKLGSASAGYVAREENLVVAVGKLSSMSNVQGTPKLPNSDSYRSPDTTSSSTAARTVPFTKRVKVSSSTVSKKETVRNGLSAEGNLHGDTILQSKGSAISEDNSLVKKNTRASSFKHKLVESKENGPCPSNTSSAENSTSSSGSGRLGGPPQNQSTSLLVKLAHSDSVTKNIRKTSPNYQASSRVVNHPTTMHPLIPPSIVNTSTTLSDEELAKRLHHELNSSPRVSRVPRGLNASGIQFASTTSASMLSKRSSSSNSGGKLQVLHDSKVSRRRNKEDTGKDATHSREASDKVENLEHMPFTTHEKLSESFHVSDSIKKDVHKAQNILHSVKETSQLEPIAVDGSGPLFRTLPGLIDEIMKEGRHMTYEELCDAVLPHWSSLRKPNGEQYVYSNHSLAVLDCLRNKDEWAHLVDYEPKTYSSKKRSKSNVPRSTEGSTNGKAKGASMGRKDRNEESRSGHLPTKGKRLARKRRKLMLRGRAVQVSRGRESGDVSDDDLPSLSGEEGSRSLSSKDEIRGSGRNNSASGMSDSSPEESD